MACDMYASTRSSRVSCSTVNDSRVERDVGADDEGGLPFDVALLDDLHPVGEVGDVPPGAGEPEVAGQQVVDVTGDPYPGGDQQDQVVADAFQVGHQMGGEDHARVVLRREAHQRFQELPPGHRVQAGHRLVEQEQLRPFRDGQGERELGALAAREPAGLLPGVQAELGDPLLRHRLVPAGVGAGAEPEVIGDRQARVGRRVLRDEPDLGQLGRTGRRHAAEDFDGACRRGQHAGRQPQQRRLAGAVRADECRRPGRPGCRGCSRTTPGVVRIAWSGPRLSARVRSSGLLGGRADGGRDDRFDALVVQPGGVRLVQPGAQLPA